METETVNLTGEIHTIQVSSDELAEARKKAQAFERTLTPEDE